MMNALFDALKGIWFCFQTIFIIAMIVLVSYMVLR